MVLVPTRITFRKKVTRSAEGGPMKNHNGHNEMPLAIMNAGGPSQMNNRAS